MDYASYIAEAISLVIFEDDNSGRTYCEPHFKKILTDAGQTPDKIYGGEYSWNDIKDILMLEVERREKHTDNAKTVVDWVYSVISTVVDPTVIDQENELMKTVNEYITTKNELENREKAVEAKETSLDQKENIVNLVPGMNFSKKTTR